MIYFIKIHTRQFFIILAAIFLIISNPSLNLGKNKKEVPRYVGSEACMECHKNQYQSFKTYAKKATSYRSIERLKDKLTEEELKGCYFCHTTGYGKHGGFISVEKTPHLKDAGCEVCHGPGEFHIKTKSPDYIKRRMTIKDCEVCHTEERVKAFRYKPLIHGGAH